MCVLGIGGAASAQSTTDLAKLSLEELLEVPVTSVAKKEQRLFETPSAIAVITGDDIRRAGVDTLAEALRLVPGLQVASIDGNRWAVSARGFNSLYANKLLVMVDGRSVYNSTYSGVFWDSQDVPLEDVDRIEVIRGPGAAMWGANAVNGVINVITKSARDSQGAATTLRAGSDDHGSVSAKYGGRVGADSFYRVSTKFLNRGQTDGNGHGAALDAWRVGQVQGRFETSMSPRDSVVTTAAFSSGRIGQSRLMLTGLQPWEQASLTTPIDTHQFSVLTRWNRAVSPRSDLFVQASADHGQRDETLVGTNFTVFNFDFQHRVSRGTHDVVWGVGQRATSDRVTPSFAFRMARERERVGLTNVFAQDEITLVPERLKATVGAKVEYSSVSGTSTQPNVRVAMTPTRHQTVWAAASHAIRTPSRNERFMSYRYLAVATPTLPLVLAIDGNDAIKPEGMNAFELGYRIQPMSRLQVDATAFANRYRDIERLEDVTFLEHEPAPLHLVNALRYINNGTASTHGIEALVTVQATRRWQLSGGGSTLTARFADDGQVNLAPAPVNAYSPGHQWFVASRATLARGVEFDTTLFRVGALEAGHVPGYSRLDARVGWRKGKADISLIAQNLLERNHLEFDQIDGLTGSRIPRSIAARLTLGF